MSKIVTCTVHYILVILLPIFTVKLKEFLLSYTVDSSHRADPEYYRSQMVCGISQALRPPQCASLSVPFLGGLSARFSPWLDFRIFYTPPSIFSLPLQRSIAARESAVLSVELDHIAKYADDADLVVRMASNTARYVEIISKALDEILDEVYAGIEPSAGQKDIFDTLLEYRLAFAAANTPAGLDGQPQDAKSVKALFPPRLLRRYEVHVKPMRSAPVCAVRQLRASNLGSLVKLKGICTRATDVKPMVTVATYTCDTCGYEIYQEVNGRQFMPLDRCPAEACTSVGAAGLLRLQPRGSKFLKYQELRVQELPDQVPTGHIPRGITVVARGEATRHVKPGDVVVIHGVYSPVPYTGWQAMRAGLLADTVLDMHSVQHLKRGGEDDSLLERELLASVDKLAEDEDVYSKLARSIAPEIWGHEDVKKALLLQLVGGVTAQQGDGMRIRGDINICLLGDPGVAKSQLLKHISTVAPRAVYTTGKGSSGVGLTAAIVRDPVSNELTLEGGALVLADMGIACIDEFDKMEEGDRTAIHEVMEQQTVSIAKAGITTTLNARTAVLAAANPLYGRFRRIVKDPHLNMLRNINIPPALLSRFDLLFILKDEPSVDADMALAKHVTYVHQKGMAPPLDFDPISPKVLRAYIAQAKQVDPYVPPELTAHIVSSYVDMRQDDLAASRATGGRGSLTPRQLLSILRLAQALARVRFLDSVDQGCVDEAIRLIETSKAQMLDDSAAAGAKGMRRTATDAIYKLIIDALGEGSASSSSIRYDTLLTRTTRCGYNAAQLLETVQTYEELGVLELNQSRTLVRLAAH